MTFTDFLFSGNGIIMSNKGIEIEIEVEDGEGMVETTSDSPTPDTLGYRSYCSYIESAWDQFSMDDLRYSHVRDVFPDHIIVAMGYGPNATMYKVMYTINGSDVAFDTENMTKVQLKMEWVEKSLAIKALSDERIGGYGILWGTEDRVDLHGEWFSKSTEELTKIYDAIGTLPVLFHHGIDDTIKTSVIGKLDKIEMDDIGLWWEAKVTEHELYKQYIKPLLNMKMLYSSSGTYPGAKRVDRKTSFISRWPIAEMTMTHTPAEYRFLERPLAEIKSLYKSIGIDSNLFEEENTATEAKVDGEQQDAEEAAENNNDAEFVALEREWLRLQQLNQ